MKGIYLTEQGKQEIQAKIIELEESKKLTNGDFDWNEIVVEKNVYIRILQSATILPVELKWEDVEQQSDNFYRLNEYYRQGIIIQPKQ
jgi:hypothetical protein